MNHRLLLSSKSIIFVLILFALVLAQLSLAGAGRAWAQEPATAATSHCGAINLTATWSSADNVHEVTCDVTVAAGVTLVIEAGTIVKFDPDTSLIVNGKLTVSGTELDPVYFTSIKDDTVGGDTNGDGSSVGARDDWDRIQFNNTSDPASLIDHAVIRFGGKPAQIDVFAGWGGVSLNDSSPTIQNTEITENSYCAIAANPGSFPTLTGNNLHDNDANGLCLYGGIVTVTPATWNVTDTSYFLRGDVSIPASYSLTVAPGVVVKFDFGASLSVNGTLAVSGTVDDPVYFTSLRDDTIGGDTNGNGSSTGARGDWKWIKITTSSEDTALINHAVIRFGGDDGDHLGALDVGDSSPTVQNTTISQNAFAGLSVKNAVPALTCVNIFGNLSSGSVSYGLYNSTPGTVVPAENVWWGSASGPYNDPANPSGTGNAVSNGVDFMPWATEACGKPHAFSKTSPPAGSNNQPVNPTTLSWETSSEATSYEYCLDTSNNSACNASWISTGSDTSALVVGLSLGTTYYWEVRARNPAGTTLADGGAWWSFATQDTTASFRSTATYDGWTLESSETSSQGGTKDSGGTTLRVGDNLQDKQYRSILSFSTAGLPDNAVISSAQVMVCSAGVVGTDPFTTHGGLRVDIRKPYFGSAVGLVVGDFQAAASASNVATFGTTPSGGCYTATLNSTGRQNVNRTGTTQFRLRFATDDNDDLGYDYIKFYSGNYATGSLRPVLIIQYHLP